MFKESIFTYDGKSSSDMGWKIVNFGTVGMDTSMVGIPLSIEETKVKRNPKPFFHGVEVTPNLQFKIQIAYMPKDGINETYVSQQTLGATSKWLFKQEYSEFKIIDTDYTNITYNCMFQNPKKITIANYPYGLELDVICDRPWGYFKKTITKTVNGSLNFKIRNEGFYTQDILPKVQFTLSGGSTSFSIQNVNTNKTTIFSNLTPNEIINFDSQTNVIVSSLGINRSTQTNFNFVWFKLNKDYEQSITIVGIGTAEFRFEFPMPM